MRIYHVEVIITPNEHNPRPEETYRTQVSGPDAPDKYAAKSYALAFCPIPFGGRDVTVLVDGEKVEGRF